jgi:hypothetical protein
LKLARNALGRLETERPSKRFGAGQVRLLELEPRDVGDLDDRICRQARMFAGEGPLFTVQVFMHVPSGADHWAHHDLRSIN